MTSGGSCRSESITTAASPSACASPALIEIWWPKLREKDSTRTRRSDAASPRRRSRVPSRLPSLMK
jgi:hypothetical protein